MPCQLAAMKVHAESQLGRPYMLRGWWQGMKSEASSAWNWWADVQLCYYSANALVSVLIHTGLEEPKDRMALADTIKLPPASSVFCTCCGEPHGAIIRYK